ncbi:MAG: hypothetical protein HY827_10665 [Actinobacteria bacterium]|nr:hypothetical protein [Actinomycetota bacterium]
MSRENEDKLEPAESDADARRRRRRWLYAFASLGIAAVSAVAVVQLVKGNDSDHARDLLATKPTSSVVLERFELKAPNGGRAQGLVELIRKDDKTSLRMIAVRLKPSVTDEVYQVSLTGGDEDERLLGGEVVGGKGTFIARADINSEELHKYSRIEMRRVGSTTVGSGKLVLRSRIPR